VWIARLSVVADRLVARYGVPRLGNYRDPVREIFYIMLSARTADAQYRATYAALHARYATLEALAKATPAGVRACIRAGGLANTRSRHIILAARKLQALGTSPTTALRRMSAVGVFEFLCDLPGVGPKSALCVMMYSLRMDAFPVDVNVQRIAARLGIHPAGLTHGQSQRWLAPLAPVGRSLELHVGLVVHGRKICVPRNPKCGECHLRDLCAFGKRQTESHRVARVGPQGFEP